MPKVLVKKLKLAWPKSRTALLLAISRQIPLNPMKHFPMKNQSQPKLCDGLSRKVSRKDTQENSTRTSRRGKGKKSHMIGKILKRKKMSIRGSI